jgi:hypothetical protein
MSEGYFCWVIEQKDTSDRVLYMGTGEWTTSIDDAVQFVRQKDADAVIFVSSLSAVAHAVEHGIGGSDAKH